MRTAYRFMVLAGLMAMAVTVFAEPPIIAPPTPTDLAASFELHGLYSFVHLKWDAPMAGLFFRVYRSVDDSTSFTPLSVTNTRAYDDYLVALGHTYYYYVVSLAVDGGGVIESPPSAMVKISVGSGSSVPHGIVEGTVTDSVSGQPLPMVQVFFYRFFPMSMRPMIPVLPIPPAVWTDSAGHYMAALDTGMYFIRAVAWRASDTSIQYVPEWFDDALTIDKATKVNVADSSTFTADFDLARVIPPVKVHLSGVVRDSAGNPLNHATVAILRSIQDLRTDVAAGNMQPGDVAGMDIDGCGFERGVVWVGQTDTLGQYQATVLAGKPYVVEAIKKFYQVQFFDHKNSPSEANILTLSGDTTGIDFNLNLIPAINNSVAGTVKDSTGMGVQSRILLIPLRPQPAALAVRFTNTDSSGVYLFDHVKGGKYLALAIPYDNFAPAFYKAGAFGVIHWKDADTITVAGAVTGIDIGVVPVQTNGVVTVHGRVLTNNSAALEGANVFLVDGQGGIGGYGMSDATGAFSISMVSAGTYSLVVDKEGYSSSTSSLPVSGMSYNVPVADVTVTSESPTSVPQSNASPLTYQLEQNYPNPFNPTTVIQYSLPQATNVTLRVFNILGQEVATLVNALEPAGTYRAVLDGHALASGVYIYRLQAGSFTDAKRMVLVK